MKTPAACEQTILDTISHLLAEMESSESKSSGASVDDIFDIPKDRFTCITINSTSKTVQCATDDEFEKKLSASIDHWRGQGIRGLWAKIALQHSSLVPICAKAGFVYHHAHSDHLMMKKWLSTTEKDCLPNFANQFLGCGGFTVNDRGQVLVIKEKYHQKPRWKFPGGMADHGEDIADAAKREVFEETGIESEFVCVLTFRHQHNFRWQCSDFYYICLMKALSTDIKRCTSEIAECKWMDVEEYVEHDVTDQNRYAAQCFLKMKETSESNTAICMTPMLNYSKTTTQPVYSVQELNLAKRIASPSKETSL